MSSLPHSSASFSGHQSTNSNSRRNGKLASCEPCRLNKTKCDHKQPKCDRCIQRGVSDRCFYHPAPLTKHKDAESHRRRRDDLSESSRAPKRRRVSGSARATTPPAFSSTHKFADAETAKINRPGYLGPTSHEAILPKDETSPLVRNREASISSEGSDQEMAHQYSLTKSMRQQMATDILSSLRHYHLIRELFYDYFEIGQTGFVPLPMEQELIDALQPLVEQYNLVHSVPDPRLVSKVLHNSTLPLDIPSTCQAHEFYRLVSGDRLRFETIGFVLATAGRAVSFGLAAHHFKDSASSAQKLRLADEFLRASTTSIMLCTSISPVNDVTTWMLVENYLLTLLVSGISGPPSWRRLGDLQSQIYALGLHRETNESDSPFWLLETRRRVFCYTYTLDKTISTFLGRPIRLSARHADVKMPLDLSDTDLMADQETLNDAIASLDKNGWNTLSRCFRVSWIRLRYISSKHREEILDFTLAKIDEDAERKLLDISRRIHESWDEIPLHFRYRSSCWEEGLRPSLGLLLVAVHQGHWYNEFMIRNLLGQKQSLTTNLELLRVATSILSETLTLGTIHDRSYDIHKDFLGQLILFGAPCASVLANALKEQQRTGQPFPPSISRGETIRMLSVLISHFDSAPHLEFSAARPGAAHYKFCRKASKAFTRIVDSVLDPRSESETTITPTGTDLDLHLNFDAFMAPGLDAFEGMEFTSGNDGIDWGTITQWSL